MSIRRCFEFENFVLSEKQSIYLVLCIIFLKGKMSDATIPQ